jgi:hypothetical protein
MALVDELVPRFSHRENFADFCEDLVAWVGTTLEPRFSHREKIAGLGEIFVAYQGSTSTFHVFSQRKFCDYCEDFIAWVDELVPRFSHRGNFAVFCEDFVAQASKCQQPREPLFSHREYFLWVL